MRASWMGLLVLLPGCILEDNPGFGARGTSSAGGSSSGSSSPGDTMATGVTATDGGPMAGTRVVDVCAGRVHTCAVLSDGTLWCWGGNPFGQLGDGTLATAPQPISIPIPSGAATVACGEDFTCATAGDGTAWCWGRNSGGNLGFEGLEESPTPSQVAGLTGVKQIAAGGHHACAALDDGQVACWGRNWDEQSGTDGVGPAVLAGISGAVDVAAGNRHSCALSGDGTIRCWGFNGNGQVGISDPAAQAVPVEVPITDAVELMASGYTTCARRSDGTAWCWGSNDYGKLGPGIDGNQYAPVRVGDVEDVEHLAVGEQHLCVVYGGHIVECYGSNLEHQHGFVRPLPLSAPVERLVAGGAHNCAILEDGDVHCWGRNAEGQIGDGSAAFTAMATTVDELDGVTAIDARGHNTCAVLADGSAWCWGANFDGQLGDGTTYAQPRPVRAAAGLTDAIVQVAVGGDHSCALDAASRVWCWGGNWYGQLGNGTNDWSREPVLALENAASVSSNWGISCAVGLDGRAWCWGAGHYGQLGNGTNDSSSVPVEVGVTDVVAIAPGEHHTCAVTALGAAYCWGANWFGMLGTGSNDDSLVPEQVNLPASSRAVAIVVGDSSSCAVTDEGVLWCWGESHQGEFAAETPIWATSPQATAQLDVGSPLVFGGAHLCGKRDGLLVCSGRNVTGQLGDGTTLRRSQFVPAEVPADVVSVATGEQHSCSHHADGTVRCFGSYHLGQVGDGQISTAAWPVAVQLGS